MDLSSNRNMLKCQDTIWYVKASSYLLEFICRSLLGQKWFFIYLPIALFQILQIWLRKNSFHNFLSGTLLDGIGNLSFKLSIQLALNPCSEVFWKWEYSWKSSTYPSFINLLLCSIASWIHHGQLWLNLYLGRPTLSHS